ncbi:MAG TPA: hypothetical protein VM753_20805 [Anaeromyxobacter sp.]|nr:hypothetical protein [Anaeromyxobacter sp.]
MTRSAPRTAALAALALAAAASLARAQAPSPAAPAAPAAVAPAPPAPPPPTPAIATLVRAAFAVEPSGAKLPLAPAEETVVDAGATFRIEIAGSLSDGRLVLLDAANAMVPASGTREVGDASTFTLAPSTPLVPGSRYALRLDGARTRELHDATGRAFAPMSLAILVAGEPPPKAEPKATAKKKRARRR